MVMGRAHQQPAGRLMVVVWRVGYCDSRASRILLTDEQLVSRRDHDQYFEWSPDSQWLLVQFTEQGGGNDEVGIIHASGNGQLINLTKSGFNETRPRWMLNGKMIFYSSDRSGLHSYDNSGTTQSDIFAVFTDEASWWDFTQGRQQEEQMTGTDSLKTATKTSSLPDAWQSTSERKVRISTNAALLSDALMSKNGKILYYLAKFEKNYDLWQTDLRTRETKRLIQLNRPGGQLQWDKEKNGSTCLPAANCCASIL